MKTLRHLSPLVTALVSTGLLAHHGAVTNSALYVMDEILELEGELIEVLWQNPYTRGRLSVVNDAGEATVREVKLDPGSISMARRGLAAEDFLGNVGTAGHAALWNRDDIYGPEGWCLKTSKTLNASPLQAVSAKSHGGVARYLTVERSSVTITL